MSKPSIATLEKRIENLQDLLQEITADRDLYRNFLMDEYVTQRSNSVENKYTPPAWIMSRITQVFSIAKPFYWKK